MERRRTVGIIAEYDPFHRGHAWQLAEAKRRSGAGAAIVAMSGFFTQRGEPACLSPIDRARCALAGGADLVLLLPACWSLRPAEGFALGGMRLLQGMGVDAVSFGAETEDLALLRRASALQEDARVRAGLREGLDRGLGWAEALRRAAEPVDPEAAALLDRPNCVLAMAYLRAAEGLGFAPEFVPVLRTAPHHGSGLQGPWASGSALRGALFRGEGELLAAGVPPRTAESCRRARETGSFVPPRGLEQATLARLRTMDAEAYRALPDCTEGLDDALRRAARDCVSLEQLTDRLSGKRYPRARIRRLCASALLGLRREMTEQPPEGAVVLGVRRGMEPLLGQAEAGFSLWTRGRDYPAEAPWMRAEARAADLWALAAGLPAGLLGSQYLSFGEGAEP